MSLCLPHHLDLSFLLHHVCLLDHPISSPPPSPLFLLLQNRDGKKQVLNLTLDQPISILLQRDDSIQIVEGWWRTAGVVCLLSCFSVVLSLFLSLLLFFFFGGGEGRTNEPLHLHMHIHSGTQTVRHTDRHRQRQIHRQTDTQTGRQTDSHTDRQTDRHTDRHTDRRAHFTIASGSSYSCSRCLSVCLLFSTQESRHI